MKNVIYITRDITIYELVKEHIKYLYLLALVCTNGLFNLCVRMYLSYYIEHYDIKLTNFIFERFNMLNYAFVLLFIITVLILTIEITNKKQTEWTFILLCSLYCFSGIFKNFVIKNIIRDSNLIFGIPVIYFGYICYDCFIYVFIVGFLFLFAFAIVLVLIIAILLVL